MELGNLFTPGKTGALYELVGAENMLISEAEEFAAMIDVLTDPDCYQDCDVWFSGDHGVVLTNNYYAAQAWGENRRLESTLAEIHGVPEGAILHWVDALGKRDA